MTLPQTHADSFLGKQLTVVIDRPLGTRHPEWQHIYPINYGFVPGTKSADGEEIDVYVLGIDKPVSTFHGECIAVIHRVDDDDDKLIIVPMGQTFTDKQIREFTNFQEQFFESIIIR